MSRVLFIGYGSNSFSGINNVSFLYDNGEDKMLVDCGATVPLNMHSIISDFGKINYCFISHSHFDHFLGLPYFIMGRHLDIIANKKKDSAYQAADLNVIVHPSLKPLIQHLLSVCHPDVKKLSYDINFIDLHDGLSVTAAAFSLLTKQMDHTVETYGLSIFEGDSKVLSYSSDTLYNDEILSFLRGSHFLVIEGMVPEAERDFSITAKHATFSDAMMVSRQVQAKHNIIVHLQPRFLNNVDTIEAEFKSLNNGTQFPKVGVWYELHI